MGPIRFSHDTQAEGQEQEAIGYGGFERSAEKEPMASNYEVSEVNKNEDAWSNQSVEMEEEDEILQELEE